MILTHTFCYIFFCADNMTGINSVYTMFEGHEVMFHVSVMLPYSTDTQQVCIIFNFCNFLIVLLDILFHNYTLNHHRQKGVLKT